MTVITPRLRLPRLNGDSRIARVRDDVVRRHRALPRPAAYMKARRICATGLPLREAREIFEREYLLAQIARFSGNISRTSEFIGMERSALHRKLKSLGIGG